MLLHKTCFIELVDLGVFVQNAQLLYTIFFVLLNTFRRNKNYIELSKNQLISEFL